MDYFQKDDIVCCNGGMLGSDESETEFRLAINSTKINTVWFILLTSTKDCFALDLLGSAQHY